MVLKREVTAVDRVELGGDHHLTLVCFEKLPRIGDRIPVVPDIVEEIEYDLVDAGASQQGAVDRPNGIVAVQIRVVKGRPTDGRLHCAKKGRSQAIFRSSSRRMCPGV